MQDKLWSYKGPSGSMAGNGGDIILHDINDDEKAPVRLEVVNPQLREYIYELAMTDDEERYIPRFWFYDRNLFLCRVEIPAKEGPIPAKAIWADDFLGDMEIFGPREHITTDEPEPMSTQEYFAYRAKCRGM